MEPVTQAHDLKNLLWGASLASAVGGVKVGIQTTRSAWHAASPVGDSLVAGILITS